MDASEPVPRSRRQSEPCGMHKKQGSNAILSMKRIFKLPTGRTFECDSDDEELTTPLTKLGVERLHSVTPKPLQLSKGAYGTLACFLKDCFLNGHDKLSKDEFEELMDAVDALGSEGYGQAIDIDGLVEKLVAQDDATADFVKKGVGVLQTFGLPIDDQEDGNDSHVIGATHSLDIRNSADSNFMPWYGRRLESFLGEIDSQGDIETMLSASDFNAYDLVTPGVSRTVAGDKDMRLLIKMFKTPIGGGETLQERYSISETIVTNWIEAIAGQYQWNPYHNWAHALDVSQLVWYCLTMGNASQYFNYQDILVLLTSAIAHDVGHTGYTNGFLSKTGDELAITYNDRSPLENMHSSLFFQTLQRENHNFLLKGKHGTGLGAHNYKSFREKVISVILATDMAGHLALVGRFENRVFKSDAPFTGGTKDDKLLQKETRSDRRLLLDAFLHTADLGHNFKPFEVNIIGVCVLEEEWFNQGDRERELHVPISMTFDRHKDALASTQSFFMTNFVRPLLNPFCAMLRGASYSARDYHVGDDIFLERMQENKRTWERLVATYGAKPAPELVKKLREEQAAAAANNDDPPKSGESKEATEDEPSRV